MKMNGQMRIVEKRSLFAAPHFVRLTALGFSNASHFQIAVDVYTDLRYNADERE